MPRNSQRYTPLSQRKMGMCERESRPRAATSPSMMPVIWARMARTSVIFAPSMMGP